MRDSIIVNVSELRSIIQDARRTGAKYVKVTISDSFEEDGEVFPASLSLCTCDAETCVEFEPIEAPANESELSDAMIFATHMSSNLL